MSGLLWPVPEKYGISQGFGGNYPWEAAGFLESDAKGGKRARRLAFKGGAARLDLHGAIDVPCPIGTPLVAPEDGKIVQSGVYSSTGEKYLMLRIHRGTEQTICFFTHLSRVTVPVGERVKRGETIAKTGNSGMSTGPHLHWEVRVGPVQADPSSSGTWFKWNPKRLAEGGDLADSDFIK